MKSNKTHLPLIFVLALGLVSCSKEKEVHPSDAPNKLEAPVLKTGDEVIDFKSLNSDPNRVWDLSDSLSFNEKGGFNSLEVDSLCTWRGHELRFNKALEMKSSYKFREFVAPSALFIYLKDKHLNCSIDFVAKSSSGDRHSFQIKTIKISEVKPVEEIEILDSRTNQLINSDVSLVFPMEELLNLKAKIGSRTSDGVLLGCNDVTIASEFRAKDFRNLDDLDFSEFTTKEAANEWYYLRPVQHCRLILTNEKNDILATSQLISIYLGGTPVEVNYVSSSGFDLPYINNSTLPIVMAKDLYITGYGIEGMFLEVTNKSPHSTLIRVPATIPHTTYGLRPTSPNEVVVNPVYSPPLFLSGDNSVQVPPNSYRRLSYRLTASKKTVYLFPWLSVIGISYFEYHLFQTDAFNGPEDNHLMIKTKTMSVALPKNVFRSQLSQERTEEIFKDQFRP